MDASEQATNRKPAIQAAYSLLALNPPDKAGAHYRLAKLLHATGDPEAKRQVLMALEETPRFRDAQRLLLKLVEQRPDQPPAGTREKQP